MAFNAGLNFYSYVHNNPTRLVDPTGLFGLGDVIPAYRHYCDGTGTPWNSSFASINWGNTNEDITLAVLGMIGGSCADKTIPVNMQMHVQTWGADAEIIGRHFVRVQGTIRVSCNCTWSFEGDMSSWFGYDPFVFPASDRGLAGEALTWAGRNGCKGKPFNINLPGSVGISLGGFLKTGVKTCPCKK